ncbi:bifunctional alpha/beta hydrolase/OsmC family protein [Azohydromonas australica]|uniref:bifunctional alpha/beta hydrolase/OsmC family protein n=1 Tax=Azohydromonas australica TaxID=364039 RepID=UPI0003F71C58|nr:bifunctional alpha/beta hydrolase/OsmC family protein [Azohydromonas australica]
MHSKNFEFQGAQGQRLSGRLDLPEGAVRSHALFAHCFTCTKQSLAASRIARALAAQGIGVLRFDFTGLGQSGGDFADSTFSGSVEDLLAAARAMQAAGIGPRLLIGHSLGGAAALAAAGSLPELKAVATIAAPFDVQHVRQLFGDGLQALLEQGEAEVRIGGRPFRMRRDFLDDLERHDQRQRIAALRLALLVLHAPLDAIVDIANAGAIFQAAHHPKSFVSLDDADHLLTRAEDAAYAADVIAAWATRYLGKPAPRGAAEPGEVVVEDTGEGDFQVGVTAGPAFFVADEPVEVGGVGSGPTPYELVAAGLGACTVMTMRLYARRKGLPLRHVRVRLGHARNAGETPPDVFLRNVTIEGDLSDEQRQRLMEIADRCPVHNTLERGARVQTREVRPPQAPQGLEAAGQHAQDMEADTGDMGNTGGAETPAP